jgi:hypothetical protein
MYGRQGRGIQGSEWEMGKRPPGILEYRWEDTIRMDSHEVECGAWTGVMWLRIATGGGRLCIW